MHDPHFFFPVITKGKHQGLLLSSLVTEKQGAIEGHSFQNCREIFYGKRSDVL